MKVISKRTGGGVARVLALPLGAALVVAACGSSGTHTAATTPGTTAGTTASTAAPGKSYTVMVATDVTSPVAFSAPEAVPAVQGALSHVPGVKVVTCDTQGSVTASQTCEHNAVADHVAAVVLGYSAIASDQSILTQAGIPVIGTADTTSPTSFALSNGNGEYAGIGIGLSKGGCTRLGILYLDGTDFLANNIVAGATWQSVTKAAIPINAPDLTPSVAKLAEGKVGCIAISTEPNTVVQAMTAIKQTGLNVKVAMVSALLSPQVLKSLGSTANGIISVENQADPAVSSPVITEITNDMKAINAKAPVTPIAVLSWASARLIVDAAQTITGPVTSASMLAALNGLRNASTDGALQPFSAIPLPNPAYKRFFNHYGINYVIENGFPTQSSGFYDLSAALK
jgi:hypothetical protein